MAENGVQMKPWIVKENKEFIGRHYELGQLKKIGSSHQSSIVVVYGRRRVGKTELLEQAFRNRNILKFEGREGLSEKEQIDAALAQLSLYVEDSLPTNKQIKNWGDFFQLLSSYTATGVWTIYLEELQWLANYKKDIISHLKYVWDNYFRHNPDLIVVLCGSSSSFMLNKVVSSQALYNRSQYEFPLKEMTVLEAKEFLKNKGNPEVFDAYLTLGGIPEYLNRIKNEPSLFLGICNHSFGSGSFFSKEYQRIFTSSLAGNKHYKEIIEKLSKKKYLARSEFGLESGGALTDILTDLEQCEFIEKYHPFNASSKSLLSRYTLQDSYLYYYFKFIKPIEKHIQQGVYNANPKSALNTESYYKWLGLSFERWCRKYHYVIAKTLGFSGVRYQSGSFFSRATEKQEKGFQIDLLFERADNVLTICEIKYLQGKVSTAVIDQFERKLSLLPHNKNKTIQKVLICPEGAEDALYYRGYFDHILTFDDLLNPKNWP